MLNPDSLATETKKSRPWKKFPWLIGTTWTKSLSLSFNELLMPIRTICILAAILLHPFSGKAQDSLKSSNIPIVIINYGGSDILDEPKVLAKLAIVDHPNKRNYIADTATFKCNILIERRGSSSQAFFPQISYSLKLIDSVGNDLNESLMGMPEEHDWILYAPYNDKTCLRNCLS